MKRSEHTDNIKDRRGGADLLARALAVFNVLAWAVMVLILVVAERAKPQFESFFDRCYHLDIRTCWDLEFVHYLLWITMAGIVASSLGLILGVVRARRRTDSSRFGLVVMGLLSFAGICSILLFLV
ncbi:hypothetical protein HRM2_19640 [Desulforapulum autotrophicum HRM2]|uniref:Uncharacterized protein n=1 Tax=Desulforapulum autotrophicum (strain ATCC 43914 / DSM 3382 / VKM B-1955 / HRM2) TaxID=177437 RepID=C0QCI8_DESAH|nr:hypothetical protein [Desulforapulum autotrophicum]ACN15065.1 hypothetical protein HRM2_19640 [Desulforapulum autotrophicum HRM2]